MRASLVRKRGTPKRGTAYRSLPDQPKDRSPLPLRHMRVRLSDPAFVQDLISYLRSTECLAEQTGVDAVEVEVPRAPSAEQAERELTVYLAAWRAMHPGVHADFGS